jgi:uncharacterized protein YndB with AHSA1/START domain
MEKIELLNYIKSPVSVVYHALTTEKGLSETWTSKLSVRLELGFVNEFFFVDERPIKMKITELETDKRIVWECLGYEPEWVGTVISFELAEKDGSTSVVLRHLNWKKLNEFYRWCNYNWAMFLYSLKTYCEEGAGIPFQRRKF